MSKDTSIEWADSSLNLQMGCTGCELWKPGVEVCYAGTLTRRYHGSKGWPKKFEEPVLYLDRLDAALGWSDLTGKDRTAKPWLNGMPRLIFLNDMGDTFTEGLDLMWLAPLLPRLAESKHQWLVLTKRPERMVEFSQKCGGLPLNVWPGVSVTSDRTAHRIEGLRRVVGGGPRWVSYEPALGPVVWDQWVDAFQWLIIGGLSGDLRRPTNIAWLRSAAVAGLENKIPVFLKQLGAWVHEPYYLEDEARRMALLNRRHDVMVPSSRGGTGFFEHLPGDGQPPPDSMIEWCPEKKGSVMSEWPFDLQIRKVPVLGATA